VGPLEKALAPLFPSEKLAQFPEKPCAALVSTALEVADDMGPLSPIAAPIAPLEVATGETTGSASASKQPCFKPLQLGSKRDFQREIEI